MGILLDINLEKIKTLKKAKDVLQKLLNFIEELIKKNSQLFNEIQTLKTEIAKLKKQSKKPKHINRKKNTNNNYSTRNLIQKLKNKWSKSKKKEQIKIDREEDLPEVEICSCGSSKFQTISTWNKIVQGLIIKRDNVCYRGRDKKCKHCGLIHRSHIPEDIKGKEFSSQLRTWVSLFKYSCRMSEQLIHEFLTETGILISIGQINNIILKNSKALELTYAHLKVWGLKLSYFFHSDATSFLRRLRASKTYIKETLHFVGHNFLSLFKITNRYNSITLMEKVLGKRALYNILISDDASPYGKRLLMFFKQLCWIHEIRHYLKLSPAVTAHKRKLKGIINELWKWYSQAKHYTRDPTSETKQKLATWFEQITSQKTGYEQLDKRLELTRKKQNRLLLFLDYPFLPIENNLAERDLRPAVLMRRLTGGTKSKEGNISFERHLSIIQTIKKQRLNVFETLHALINRQLSPFILTAKTLPVLTS